MEFNRRVGDRMCFVLLILGNVVTALALPGVNNTPYQNLVCINDILEWMSCDFEAQNCSQYNVTISNIFENVHCIPKQCDNGQCCCSTKVVLILGDTYTAEVWKRGEIVGSENISITDGIKPRVPTITSVKESNGNFQVMWKSNMESNPTISDSLNANVTYYKKGYTEKVSEFVMPTTVKGMKYYEIHGRHLVPSTTYVVCVKSYLQFSRRSSDCSAEWEFTTAVSRDDIPLVTVISLSIAAVIISSAIYGCYAKFKAKWWDPVAKCPNPKLLDMHPSKQEILKPVLPLISSVSVEPLIPEDSKPWLKESLRDISSGSSQHSCGISTGSSCISYVSTEPVDIIAGVQDALGKAFPNISPISPLTTSPLKELNIDCGFPPPSSNLCDVRSDDLSSGSHGFDNKTYSILIPSFPVQIMADGSEVQSQTEMLSDSVYHPSEGDIVICADQQLPAWPLITLPPVVSSRMATDMSYQQCNADSVQFSFAADSSLSSIANGSNTTASCDPVSRVEAGRECTDEVAGSAAKLNLKTEKATICDENPCYGFVPAGSHSFPPVYDDYQAFQSLVEQQSGADNEHLNKYPEESCTKMSESFFSPVVPSFANDFQGGSVSRSLQRPSLSADQSMPVITDSSYQSV